MQNPIPPHLDRAIAVVSNLSLALTRMLDAYGEVAAVLTKEVEAIESHNLISVEHTAALKTAAANKVEAEYTRCEEDAHNLVQLYLQVTGEAPAPSAGGVSGCLQVVAKLTSALSVDGERSLRLDILGKAQANLSSVVSRFVEVMQELKPALEKNRAIVSTLLRNHQESNAFWRQMALENASAYDATGSKKNSGPGSQLAVTV